MKFSPYLRLARGLVLRDRPIYVHYGVSSRCNLKCRSCVIWRRDTSASELKVPEVRELAAILAGLGTVQVSLGGGEPVLRKDLPEVARAFLEHDIRVRVLTNGVAMTPRAAGRLMDAGVRDFSFSVDSLRPEVQEDLDAAKGTFNKRLENLVSLAERLPATDTMPLLNVVVSPRNYPEVPAILDLAEAVGFYASIIPVHLGQMDEPDHRFYSKDGGLRFAPRHHEPLQALYRQIRNRKNRGARIINSSAFLEGSVRYLTTGSAPWPCRAGELFLSIGPDGRVTPCHAFEGTDHGVHYRDLPAHMAAPGYVDRVRELAGGCEGCFRPCWAEVGFMVMDPRSTLEMVRNQLTAMPPRGRVDRAAVEKLLLEAREATP